MLLPDKAELPLHLREKNLNGEKLDGRKNLTGGYDYNRMGYDRYLLRQVARNFSDRVICVSTVLTEIFKIPAISL